MTFTPLQHYINIVLQSGNIIVFYILLQIFITIISNPTGSSYVPPPPPYVPPPSSQMPEQHFQQ